jgi:hypothetical protein
MKPNPTPEFKPGCYFDSARGQYIGIEVIRLAESYGFTLSDEDEKQCDVYAEHYHELWDEAENYLNTMAPADYYFGSNPDSSDWGLWQAESE